MDLGSAHGSIQVDYEGAANVQKAISDFGQLSKAGGDLGQNLQTVGKTIGAIGAAAAVPIGLASKSAVDFGRNMGNVNSILKLSDSELAALGDQVQDLSADVNKGPVELSEALYDINSSGFSGAEGLDVLEASANAANAGLTSTETAARGISSVLNAYGLSAEEAGRVSDVMFQTVNDGVLTFDQLANNMGNTLPVASTLGVSFEQLGAAYAQMTLQGINASAAETQIAGLMKAALNPTTQLTDAVNAYGYESAQALVEAEGLPGLLKAIDQAAQGNGEALFDMLGTQEAVNAALVLGKDGAGNYIEEIARMEGASEGAGATQEALNEQMKTAAFQLERAGVASEAARVAFGEKLEPTIAKVANAFGDFGFMMANLPDGIQQFIATFGAAVALLGTGGGAALIAAGKIVELNKSLAQAGISAGKLGLALGVIGLAIGAGILAYQTNFLGFADAVDGALAKAGEAIDTFGKKFEQAFANSQAAGMNDMAAAVNAFGKALDKAFGTDVSKYFTKAAKAIDAFGDAFSEAIDLGVNPLTAGLSGLAQAFDALGLPEVGDRFRDLALASQRFADVFEGVSTGLAADGWGNISSAVAGFGIALENAAGLPVGDFFYNLGKAIDVAGNAFLNAQARGLNPFDAALQGLMAGLEAFTGIPVGQFFSDLGSTLKSAQEGVQTFVDTLRSGDISGAFEQMKNAIGEFVSGAGDILGPALQELSDNVQQGLQEMSDRAMEALGEVDLGQVVLNIGEWIAGKLPDLGTFIQGVLSGLGTAVDNFVDWVLNVGLPAAGEFVGDLGTWIKGKIPAAQAAVEDFTNWVMNVGLPAAGSFIGDLGSWIAGLITGGGGGQLSGSGNLTGTGSVTLPDFTDWTMNVGLPAAGEFLGDLAGWIGGKLAGLAVTVADFVDWTMNIGLPSAGSFVGDLGQWIAQAITGGGGGQLSGSGNFTGTGDITVEDFTSWALNVGLPGAGVTVENFDEALQTGVDAISGKVEDFANWLLDVTAPAEGNITVDGPGVMDAVGNAISEIFTVDQSTVDIASDLGEKLGAWLGEQLSKAIQYALDSLSGVGGGGYAGANGPRDMGPSLNLGDAFAGFDQSFTDALKAALEPQLARIPELFGQWVEEKKTDLWNAIWDKVGSFAAWATGTQDAQAAFDPTELGGEMGTQMGAIFTSPEFAAGVESALDELDPSSFENIGTTFISKVQEGIASAIGQGLTMDAARKSDGAIEGGGAMGEMFGPMIESMNQGLQAAVEQVDVGIFAPAGAALMTKIQEGLSLALSGGSVPGGTGPAPVDGAGSLGTEIVTALATSLGQAVAAVGPEVFAPVGTALMSKIQEGISSAMSGAGGGQLSGSGDLTGGQAGSGIGVAIATALATSIAEGISAAPVESFAAIGTAIQAKISEAIATAMSAGGGGQLSGSGDMTGAGIGQSIADAIATAVQGADFTAVGTAIQTGVTTPIQTALTAISPIISQAVTGWSTAFSSGMQQITSNVQTGMTSVSTAISAGMTTANTAISAGTTAWSTAFSSAMMAIVSNVQTQMTAISTAISTGMTTANTAIATGTNTWITSFSTAMTAIVSNVTSSFQEVATAVETGMQDAQTAVETALTAIDTALAGAADSAYDYGVAVGQGFADGINSMIGAVTEAGNALAAAATDAIAKAGEISSPSKVTTELGMYFGQGFVNGLDGMIEPSARAANDIGRSAIDSLEEVMRTRERGSANAQAMGATVQASQSELAAQMSGMQSVTEGQVLMNGREFGKFIQQTAIAPFAAMASRGRRNGRP